ncbi:MAG: MFS transporter [Gordonia sp. (in: high G+C Gram-positive bacteria)]
MDSTLFRRLYGAQVISLLGTGLMTVALGLLAYELAGPDAGRVLGTALAVKMIAYVVMSPAMRALLTRVPATRVLVGADLVRVAMAACLPMVGHIWAIYVLIFALQTASATFTPTFQAAIARVVTDRDAYTSAVSASRVAYDLESVGSPAIAAALLSLVSYSALFACTAIGFAASAVLVSSSGLAQVDRANPAAQPSASVIRFWRNTFRGIRFMFSRNVFRIVLWINIPLAAATAVVVVNTVVYVRADAHLGDTAVAIVLGVFGAGSITAALVAPWLMRHVGVTTAMIAGAVTGAIGLGAGAGHLALDWPTGTASIPTLAAIWFVLGAGTSLMSTGTARLIRDHTDDHTRDDVFTAQFSASHAAYLATYPLAGWGGALVGNAGSVAALATIALLGSIGAYSALHRSRSTRTEHPVTADNSPKMSPTAAT